MNPENKMQEEQMKNGNDIDDDEEKPMLESQKEEIKAAFILYDEAIAKVVPEDPKSPPLSCCKCCMAKFTCSWGILQFWSMIALFICKNVTTLIIHGLSFLIKPAHHYECYEEEGDYWSECKKSEICGKGLSAD